MRILLVSHPPLSAELGAAQLAINLAAALSDRGHEARAWSPEPLPGHPRWWNLWVHQRRAIERFAAAEGPFDVIDAPAVSATSKLAGRGLLVARSVQPELRYLLHAVRNDLGRHPSPRAAAHALMACPIAAAVTAGWHRADSILCLGGDELLWMRRRFPFWASKLKLYVISVAPHERPALAEIRRRRGSLQPAGVRFLWIGRWTPHKGTRSLVRFLRQRLAAAPEDTCTLAGCGLLAERDLPREWLRSGQVTLVPSFARAELPALLASHSAGLFTSEVEGWGLNLNEMLESGLTVFATAAGAVADLQPFFPSSLRPFPPPATIAAHPLEDLEANGYYRRFSWPAIACSYEEQVLAALDAKARAR